MHIQVDEHEAASSKDKPPFFLMLFYVLPTCASCSIIKDHKNHAVRKLLVIRSSAAPAALTKHRGVVLFLAFIVVFTSRIRWGLKENVLIESLVKYFSGF